MIQHEGNRLNIQEKSIQTQAFIKGQNFSNEEIEATGEVYLNPESFGFNRRNNVQPRPIPKYFFTQPKLLQTPTFQKNEWDFQNQQMMNKLEEANRGKDFQGLYENLQKLREVERKKMEEMGLVDAENISKDLNDAISFQGSCLDMCPTFERIRRQLENNVKNLEKDPSTKKISRERAVKAFSRPAAGQPPPLPSEVRPPHVLVQTLNYLVDNIVDELPEAHSFIWDRTRSIRQDFTYQNNFGPEAVDCNERIVRLHLLCLHIMSGSDVEYSQQQELEQFNKALQTLMEIYTDVRNNGGECPNEAEFRAYHLLSHIRDPELERQIQNLPNHIYKDSKVQLALTFRNLISQNNIVERGVKNLIGSLNYYDEFFKLVYQDSTPLLMACLLETQFSEIRFYALKAMSRAYHTRGKAMSLQNLSNILGFDSDDKLVKFLRYYEIDITVDAQTKKQVVDLFNKEKLENRYKLTSFLEKARYPPVHSNQLDSKLLNHDYKSFINNGKPNHKLKLESGKLVKPKIIPSLQPQEANLNSNLFTQPFDKRPEIKFESKEKVGTKPIQTQSFTPQQTNTFQFNKPKESSPPKSTLFTFPKPSESKPTAPTFQFPAQPVETKKVSFDLIPKVETFPPDDSPSTHSTMSTATSLQSLPPSSSFKDSMNYSQALEEVTRDVIDETITKELQYFLIKILQDFDSRNERSKVIESLSDELFNAFVAEVIYECAMEFKASKFYEINLKKNCIKRISSIAKKAVEKFKAKKIKSQELHNVSFKLHTTKRRRSSEDSNTSMVKKQRNTSSIVITDLNTKRNEITKLWSPLNLRSFLDKCSKNLKISIKDPSLNLKFLLIVENWDCIYSKWINSKFQLKPDFKSRVYKNQIENDKLHVLISSLPENNYLNKEFFSTTTFILFETGITNVNSNKSVIDKLKSDAKVLNKLITLINKYSYYKVHVSILFWDIKETGISTDEVAKLLNLENYLSMNNIKSLILCDMTIEGININDVLNGSLNKISSEFDGEMTSRGIRKTQKNIPKTEKKTSTVSNISNINQIETDLLNQAKQMKKYSYLNNHIHQTPSIKQSNPNQSYNASNRSILQQYISNRVNRTMHNQSSVLNSTMMTDNNESIIKGFGKGMTSSASASPNRQNINDSTLQLKELTASIKQKYRN